MSNPSHRIEKLRIRRGDIVVVRDPATMGQLSNMKFPYLNFQVPIVYSPAGIEVIPFEKLKEIVAEVDESRKLVVPGVRI